MRDPGSVIVGIDNGGTKNNVTVLDAGGQFLIDRMVEVPSRVMEGTAAALDALALAFHTGLEHHGHRSAPTSARWASTRPDRPRPMA